jgi:hypothetical protein
VPYGIAFPADLQAVAVVFDLVDPLGADRHLIGARRDEGAGEAGGVGHVARIAVRRGDCQHTASVCFAAMGRKRLFQALVPLLRPR